MTQPKPIKHNKNVAGGYVLPAGPPEGATVKIFRFETGYYDVEFDGKRFQVPMACMDHEGLQKALDF